MRLLARLRRWRSRRLHRAANDRLAAEIGDHRLSQPRLLGSSRVGRLRWTARLDGRPVKVLECHDPAQALFIEEVSASPQLREHFPEPLLREGPFLVVRWIDGAEIDWRRDRRLVPAVGEIQARLHAQHELAGRPPGEFSYLRFLEARWRRYQSVFPLRQTLEHLLWILDEQAPRLAPALCHPDLSAANLVVERSTGRIKIIDNELLGSGSYYCVDLLATYRSFGSRRRRLAHRYLQAYAEAGGQLGLLSEHRGYLEAVWLLAHVGSLLQDGAIGHAVELARDWREGRHREPELLDLAAGLTAAPG